MDTLFGGGESESKSTPQDLTPTDTLGKLRDPLTSQLIRLIRAGGPIFNGAQSATGDLQFSTDGLGLPNPNPFTSPITGNESSLISRIMSQVTQPGAPMQAANQNLADTLRGKYLDPSSNPFLAATIQAATRPLIDTFNDVTLPQLKSQFVAAGQRVQPGGSSAFDKAGAIATRGLLNNISDTAAKIAGQNFTDERNRQIQAITQAGQFNAQELTNLTNALQAVALPRLIDQLGINQGLQEFNKRVDVMLQALAIAAGKAGPYVANESTSSSSQTNGIIPGLGDLMGGAGELLSIPKIGGLFGL